MAGVTTNAVALVTLLSMLIPSVRSAVNYGTSAARLYNIGWVNAKATWYGRPTGAGPDDNGMLAHIHAMAAQCRSCTPIDSAVIMPV